MRDVQFFRLAVRTPKSRKLGQETLSLGAHLIPGSHHFPQISNTWDTSSISREGRNSVFLGNCRHVPLLVPSGPRRIVHSSTGPKGVKSCRTSSSVCCLLSIPTNSFLSADGQPYWKKKEKHEISKGLESRREANRKKRKIWRLTPRTTKLHGYTTASTILRERQGFYHISFKWLCFLTSYKVTPKTI